MSMKRTPRGNATRSSDLTGMRTGQCERAKALGDRRVTPTINKDTEVRNAAALYGVLVAVILLVSGIFAYLYALWSVGLG